MPQQKKKKKTPAQLIKENKKIAHAKKTPNLGFGMTAKPLSPATKKKIRGAVVGHLKRESPLANAIGLATGLAPGGAKAKAMREALDKPIKVITNPRSANFGKVKITKKRKKK